MAEWNAEEAESYGVPLGIINAIEIALEMGNRDLNACKHFNREVIAYEQADIEVDERRRGLLVDKDIFAVPTAYMPCAVSPVFEFRGQPEDPTWDRLEPLFVYRELGTPLSGPDGMTNALRSCQMFSHKGCLFCVAESEEQAIQSIARLNQLIVESWNSLLERYKGSVSDEPLRTLGPDCDVTTPNGIRQWMAEFQDPKWGVTLYGFHDFHHQGWDEIDLRKGLEEAAKDFLFPYLREPAFEGGVSNTQRIEYTLEIINELAPHLQGDPTAQKVLRSLISWPRQ